MSETTKPMIKKKKSAKTTPKLKAKYKDEIESAYLKNLATHLDVLTSIDSTMSFLMEEFGELTERLNSIDETLQEIEINLQSKKPNWKEALRSKS